MQKRRDPSFLETITTFGVLFENDIDNHRGSRGQSSLEFDV
jgi:hypothetical protein